MNYQNGFRILSNIFLQERILTTDTISVKESTLGPRTLITPSIFDLLNIQAPDKEETIGWLQRFRDENVFSYYYVARGLTIGGGKVADSLVDRVLGLQRPHGGFGEIDVGVEAFSEFEATYMATEILSELTVDFNPDATVELLLKHISPNGGFGAKGHSNIISTFHALASLRNLGYPVEELGTTIEYTRSCEKNRGGFTAVPESAYHMSKTFTLASLYST